MREKEYIQRLDDCGYEYISGYKNCESIVKMRCKQCNNTFEYNYHNATSKWKNKNICPYCKDTTKINKMLCEQEERLKKQLEKKKHKSIVLYKKKCKQCGKDYVSSKSISTFCCTECGIKWRNNRGSKRYKSISLDKDITLERLYKNDKGLCALCGEICDLNDYYIKNNVIVCGNNYPSIDHIKPISKGGLHSWDNVQLAHRLCNTKKSNYF